MTFKRIDHQPGAMSGFKFWYNRGLPQYLAPTLFLHKQEEEFFVTHLYAQMIFLQGIPVVGVEVCADDSNSGPDTVVKIRGVDPDCMVQVTRFSLTNYLQRKNAAQKRVERIVDEVLALGNVDFPVNACIFPREDNTKMPPDKRKHDVLLAKKIRKLITDNEATLREAKDFVTCQIEPEDPIYALSPFITLQGVPQGMHSNFVGHDNVFIEYEFSNIHFTQQDIEEECLNIFNRKNGGKAHVLLIWADHYEILYKPEPIILQLRETFKDTTFDRVVFFSFFSKKHLFQHGGVHTGFIK